ncbi:MAG: hypothetical protein WA063_07475 [Minisyncoccia bacterium]
MEDQKRIIKISVNGKSDKYDNSDSAPADIKNKFFTTLSSLSKIFYCLCLLLILYISVYLIYFSNMNASYHFIYNIFIQIIASLGLIAFVIFAKKEVTRYSEKKHMEKEVVVNINRALDMASNSSKNYIAHIFSILISIVFSFWVMGLFFGLSLYLIGIGLLLFSLPIFYQVSYNIIVYRGC